MRFLKVGIGESLRFEVTKNQPPRKHQNNQDASIQKPE